jgi:phosphopantothenoylcysteine decarboxylase
VAATKPSLTFFQPENIRRHGVNVWTDDDEWDVRVFSLYRLRYPVLSCSTILMIPMPPFPTTTPRMQPNYRIGDSILHIELRRWADVVLIAPCSANTLAKIATGICDNLVVSK